MTLPLSYAVFALVIVVSSTFVTLGAAWITRFDINVQVVLAGWWLAMHSAAFLSGFGGPWLSNALVLGSAAGVAALLARTVRTPGSLVALAVTASLVDIVSFLGGPTRFLLDAGSNSISDPLRYLAVSMSVDGDLIAVVGIGDLLIFGVLFLGLRGQGHPGRSVGAVLAGGLLAALLVGLLRGGAFGIPFMAIGVIALMYRSRRMGEVGENRPGGNLHP